MPPNLVDLARLHPLEAAHNLGRVLRAPMPREFPVGSPQACRVGAWTKTPAQFPNIKTAVGAYLQRIRQVRYRFAHSGRLTLKRLHVFN